MTLSIRAHWVSLCWMSHFIYCYVECRYAECSYAKCRYAECRGAQHNATQHSDSHHSLLICDNQHKRPSPEQHSAPSDLMLSVSFLLFFWVLFWLMSLCWMTWCQQLDPKACNLKLFRVVINAKFVIDYHLQPCLIFMGKSRSLPLNWSPVIGSN